MADPKLFHDDPGFPSDIFQLLNKEGKVLQQSYVEAIDHDLLVTFYEWMVRIRTADTKCNNLQRVGKMGTYASVYGQEAIQIAAGLSLTRKDWLVPTFRESGMMWCFGVPLKNIMLYWKGNEMGSAVAEDVNCFPIAIPVGSHLPHATGLAWANKLQKKDSVVLCSFGDGASSTGDFHAALNFAGVIKTPTVFLCQNNQFAISTPRVKQTAGKTIAQRAFSYGVKGIYVDGNDMLAMYSACKEAVAYAREHQETVLIEAVTYRLGNHTTSDNANIYREESDIEKHLPAEPLKRYKIFLESQNLWDESKEKALQEKAQKEIESIAEQVLNTKNLDPQNMFTMLYDELTPNLKEQLEVLKGEL